MISKNQLQAVLAILLIVLFIGQSCGEIASPTPSLAVPTATETVTLPPTHTLQPTSTQAPLHIVEPLITNPRLRFDSWSPNSQWIAYWFADGDDLPAHLGFINVQSGKVCQHDNVIADNIESGYVSWEKNDNVIAAQNLSGSAFSGMACEVFSPTERVAISHTESSTSPNGRYRADATISGWEGELIHNVTTITEISTKQITATVKWDGSPHIWAESGWLNNELYLVGLDINQGALYVSVPDGKVGNVVSGLLGLDVQDVGYISRVGRYTDTAKGEYHLLIERSKESPLLLLLYHSELDLVEELPFYRSWIHHGLTFSSDGKWLFLFYPSSQQNETDDLWIRSVDPPDSAALQLADGMGFAGFDLPNEAHEIAMIVHDYVYILKFPSGEMISRWGASGYYLQGIRWSPDGKRLVVEGIPVASKPTALFVIKP